MYLAHLWSFGGEHIDTKHSRLSLPHTKKNILAARRKKTPGIYNCNNQQT